MLHASVRISVVKGTAVDAGIQITARMEVSNPSEIEEQDVLREVEAATKSSAPEIGSGRAATSTAGGQEQFSRPKRPGRR